MNVSPLIIKIITIAIVPLLACSTYYTLNKLNGDEGVLYIAASVANPIMLLGFIGVVRANATHYGKRRKFWLWVSGLALVLPAALLAFIWL